MRKGNTKSARFKKLLPDIYRKLIIEGFSHLEASLWLKKEYELDLVGQNTDGKPFSNYLSLYGDIKTAKKTYRKMYGKKSVAENWLNNTAPKTAVSRPVKSLEESVTTDDTDETDKEDQSQPESSVRINEAFRKTQTTKPKIPSMDSLMDGFTGNRL